LKELYSGSLYWPNTGFTPVEAPPLQQHIDTDTAVIGGGISGALCSLAIVRSGRTAALLEKREIAGGSTAASTCLIQFSNDIMLCDLISQIGERDAKLFYRSCGEAIDQLEELISTLPSHVDFDRRSSLYFASSEQELPKLRREYEALLDAGFEVQFWESDDIAAHFPFRKPGAIVAKGDAESNPLQLVNGIAAAARQEGLNLYSHTEVIRQEPLDDGRYRLHAANGSTVTASNIIYAIGYEPEELKGQLIKAQINRSFAAVTGIEPQLNASWHERMLIWETSRPYLYMRTSFDGRVILGGLDEENDQPIHSHSKHKKLAGRLRDRLKALFPAFDAEIQYAWSASFGESRDNLPFIGADPRQPNIYYCLGYGGNGTVYSMLGSRIICDLINGRSNPLAPIVRMDRG